MPHDLSPTDPDIGRSSQPTASELEAEQRRLERALRAYAKAIEILRRGASAGIDEFAESALKALRAERLRAYTDASGPLYFGRLDLEDGDDPLYVGRHLLTDADGEPLVINWRAPAAGAFYRASPRAPMGVARRRRFDIDEERVAGFVDEQLAGAPQDTLTEAILSDIDAQRIGEMRQIIATITPEQYDVVTAPRDGVLVVQGGPGTGKTAVGLHRAAWLLFSYPDLVRNGVLVLGPSATFIRYVEQVLPSLGEHAVEQRPIERLIATAGASDPPAVAALKGDGRMALVLARAAWRRVAPPAKALEIAHGRSRCVLAPADVEADIRHVRERGGSYAMQRARFRERLAGTVYSKLAASPRGAPTEDQAQLAASLRRDPAYRRLVDQAWPRQTAEQLLTSALGNARVLREAAAGVLTDDEQALLLSARRRTRTALSPEDGALLDECRWLVDRGLTVYGHVVVDEAQNLSPMQVRMALRRTRASSLTIVGDIAQRTHALGAGSWAAVLEAAGVREAVVSQLGTSYRVPRDFLDLALRVVPASVAASSPASVRTARWPPTVVPVAGPTELTDAVASFAAALSRVGSVAVVAPDERLAALEASLRKRGLARPRDDERLSAGINVVALADVKGLEFDATVVVDPQAILAQPDAGAGGLYTALTRSTQALAIVHDAPLPAALADADELHVHAPGASASAWLERTARERPHAATGAGR